MILIILKILNMLKNKLLFSIQNSIKIILNKNFIMYTYIQFYYVRMNILNVYNL